MNGEAPVWGELNQGRSGAQSLEHGPLSRWGRLHLANRSLLREAKALLFGKLAESIRQGMPLAVALNLASRTVEEFNRSGKRQYGADTRFPFLSFFYAMVTMAMMAVAHIFFLVYALISARLADPERVSRIIAKILLVHVEKGLDLAGAMRRANGIFDVTEIRIAETGQSWGRLPEALQRLADFQVTNRRLQALGNMMIYPLYVCIFFLGLISFCLGSILPKFKEIYDQLGAGLPPITSCLYGFASSAVNGIVGLLFLPFVMIVTAVFLRYLLNGSRLTIAVMTLPMLAYLVIIIELGSARSLTNLMVPQPYFEVGLVLGFVFAFVAGLLVIPYVLGFIQLFILKCERNVAAFSCWVPFVGAAQRAEREARWLASLSLGIASGASPADAVETAGRICGGSFYQRSLGTAALVRAGLPIGAACVRVGMLGNRTNHRLALLDESANFEQMLLEVSDDSARAALETLERVTRAGAVLSILVMGVIAGIFAVAMYAPLFAIPQVIEFDHSERRPSQGRIIDPVSVLHIDNKFEGNYA